MFIRPRSSWISKLPTSNIFFLFDRKQCSFRNNHLTKLLDMVKPSCGILYFNKKKYMWSCKSVIASKKWVESNTALVCVNDLASHGVRSRIFEFFNAIFHAKTRFVSSQLRSFIRSSSIMVNTWGRWGLRDPGNDRIARKFKTSLAQRHK